MTEKMKERRWVPMLTVLVLVLVATAVAYSLFANAVQEAGKGVVSI